MPLNLQNSELIKPLFFVNTQSQVFHYSNEKWSNMALLFAVPVFLKAYVWERFHSYTIDVFIFISQRLHILIFYFNPDVSRCSCSLFDFAVKQAEPIQSVTKKHSDLGPESDDWSHPAMP